MDPCPFVRLIVDSLALQLAHPTKPAGSEIHPSSSPCFCRLRIKHFPSQTVLLPLCNSSPDSSTGFDLDPSSLRRISGNSITLRVSVFTGRMGRTCGVYSGKLLGRVRITICLQGAESKHKVFQNGWVKLGKDMEKVAPRLHLVVRSEPDPRFVFQFGGEPECSPVVFQIQENIRQPVFSCKFSADRNARTLYLQSDFDSKSRTWKRSFSGERERSGRERKGWTIMVYDLSGSPVASAAVITPFVPSPGTNRVSRSNAGAWLILRPYGSSPTSWKPWGRLEAWRERGHFDRLGYKFELITEHGMITIAESTISVKNGGRFCIERSSFAKGFVMNSSVEGERRTSKPVVQVGVQHVSSMADAALFVALSAAIDLSMDACKLFTQKLRRELCSDDHHFCS